MCLTVVSPVNNWITGVIGVFYNGSDISKTSHYGPHKNVWRNGLNVFRCVLLDPTLFIKYNYQVEHNDTEKGRRLVVEVKVIAHWPQKVSLNRRVIIETEM